MERPKREISPEGKLANPNAEKYFQTKAGRKQSPANALTEAIISYILLTKSAARRVNVQGRYLEGEVHRDVLGNIRQTKGKWIPSGMLPGFEDISAIKCLYTFHRGIEVCIGRAVSIEVKIGADRQKPPQIKRMNEVIAAGGVYIIARDFDSFKREWDSIGLY